MRKYKNHYIESYTFKERIWTYEGMYRNKNEDSYEVDKTGYRIFPKSIEKLNPIEFSKRKYDFEIKSFDTEKEAETHIDFIESSIYRDIKEKVNSQSKVVEDLTTQFSKIEEDLKKENRKLSKLKRQIEKVDNLSIKNLKKLERELNSNEFLDECQKDNSIDLSVSNENI